MIYTKPGRDQVPNDFKPIDLEISTGNDGRMEVTHDLSKKAKSKADKKAMEEEIMRLIRNGEWKDVNQTRFGEDYDVDKSTVSRKAKKILEEIDKENSLIK